MKRILSLVLVSVLLFTLVPISVYAEDDVTAIEYKTDYTVLTDGLDSEWDDYNGCNRYMLNFHEGDELTVHYSESAPVVFVAQFIDGEITFLAEGKDPIIQWQDIFTYSNQGEIPWEADNQYTYYVEYKDRRAPVNISIVSNPVLSINYYPSSPIVCYFEKGGHFEKINDEYVYIYNVCTWNTDDILEVTYNDERGKVQYILDFGRDGYVSAIDDSDVIPRNRVDMYEKQREHPYVLNGDNCFYVRYMGMQTEVSVQLVEDPVESILYYPGGVQNGTIEITEETDGEWREDYEHGRYFDYYTPGFMPGDELIITFTDERGTVTYTYRNDIGMNGFYDWQNMPLADSNELIVTKGNDNVWTPGGQNFMYVGYKDTLSDPVTVNINKNPVKAIAFERSEEKIQIVEGSNMYHDYHDDRDYYNMPEFREGDVLKVTDNNDVETVYYYQYGSFVTEDQSKAISREDINMYGDQREEPWGIGDHEYTVEYSGRTCTLTLEIIKSSVLEIEYVPAKGNIQLFEETNGDDSEGYYRYWYNLCEDGDKLIVTYLDERGKVEYKCQKTGENEWFRAFIAEDNSRVETNELNWYDEQWRNHWYKDADNYIYIEYMGKTYNLPVYIVDNPVSGISYTPAEIPTAMVGVNSWTHDEFGYDVYDIPRPEEGDKLTVSYKNEPDKIYTAVIDEHHDILFRANNGDTIDLRELYFDSTQFEGVQWMVGDDNEYYVEYLGFKSTVKCTLLQNPVESIEFVPNKITSYFAGHNMYFDDMWEQDFYEIPRINNGDKLIVNYNDGRGSVTYTVEFDNELDCIIFVSDSDVIIGDKWIDCWHDQGMSPWEIDGEDNFWYISYCGKETKVPVIIRDLESIDHISYLPLETPKVYIGDYEMATDDETGEPYVRYNLPGFEDGDKLIITYKDETSKEFTLKFDESDHERYFVNEEDGEEYHINELIPFDDQNVNPWETETLNYYLVDFYGFIAQVPVEIITTNIVSIVYVPVIENKVIDENTGGSVQYAFDGQFYYYHGDSVVTLGDKLIVTYDNEDVIEYTLVEDTENETWALRAENGEDLDIEQLTFEEDQWENHWKPGDNYFRFKYQGVRTEPIKITIKAKNPYIAGDINGDGIVNNKDITRLFQYLSGWEVYVNEAVLDVNGDKSVNNKDLIRLFQYLSGWNVQITY